MCGWTGSYRPLHVCSRIDRYRSPCVAVPVQCHVSSLWALTADSNGLHGCGSSFHCGGEGWRRHVQKCCQTIYPMLWKAMLGMDCSISCNPSVVCLGRTYLAIMVMCVHCALVGCVRGFRHYKHLQLCGCRSDAVKLICCMGVH